MTSGLACEARSPQSGMIAPNHSVTGVEHLDLGTSGVDDSYGFVPKVRFCRGPMPPYAVCESAVHISAAVVLITTSLGPGLGTGLSTNPIVSSDFITNAFMLTDSFLSSGWFGSRFSKHNCKPMEESPVSLVFQRCPTPGLELWTVSLMSFQQRLNQKFSVPAPSASQSHLNRLIGVRLRAGSALFVLQITKGYFVLMA